MKIISFIKRNIIMIILTIILIAIQAIGFVVLPEYISRIVDVGIGNYGIQYSVPIAIRKVEMDKLMIFINDENILDNFSLINSQNEIDEIEGFEGIEYKEPLYILKNNVDKEKLNNIFARAMTLLSIMNKEDFVLEIREKISTNVTEEIRGMLVNNSVRDTLYELNSTQLKTVNAEIDKKISVLTDDILNRVASKYLIHEYEIIGLKDVQKNYIIEVALQMLLIALIILISYIIGNYCIISSSAKLSEHIRNKIFERVMEMDESEFDKYTITTLINRSVYDTQVIQRTLPILIRTVVYIPIIFIGSIIKINQLGGGFEGALILVAFLIFIIGCLAYLFIMPKIIKFQDYIDRINSVERDTLNNLIISKGSGFNKQNRKFNEANTLILDNNKKVLKIKALTLTLMQLVVYFTSVYMLWKGSIMVENQTLMIGTLMAIIEYLFQISFSTISALKNTMELVKGFNSYKRCRKLFLTKNSSKMDLLKIEKINSIEFKHVFFKYPNMDKLILEDFNMKIEGKEKISIIGKNGSGKTTIIKILIGFYEIQKGEILINGINIKNIDLKSLRESISVVPQASSIISGDLNKNIIMGNEELTNDELDKVKEMAQLTELKNENRIIKYEGKNLSGGQKQRIAIARALGKKADVLIFDDAFSSLDITTKNNIIKNIKNNYKDKTIIDIGNNMNYTKIVEI